MDDENKNIGQDTASEEDEDIVKTVWEESGDDRGLFAESDMIEKKEKKLKKELDEAKKKLAEAQKKLDDAVSECNKAKKDFEETNDKYTRMIAEYDNFRKRAQKEKDGIYADAVCDALKEILTVKDNLELAVQYADKEKFSEGVVMTLNKFGEILKKLGVEEFGSEGDTFDPNMHNAVMHEEDGERPENSVASVLLKGYKKGDKILRYAMVKVVN